jgi:hypothetical protein
VLLLAMIATQTIREIVLVFWKKYSETIRVLISENNVGGFQIRINLAVPTAIILARGEALVSLPEWRNDISYATNYRRLVFLMTFIRLLKHIALLLVNFIHQGKFHPLAMALAPFSQCLSDMNVSHLNSVE